MASSSHAAIAAADDDGCEDSPENLRFSVSHTPGLTSVGSELARETSRESSRERERTAERDLIGRLVVVEVELSLRGGLGSSRLLAKVIVDDR